MTLQVINGNQKGELMINMLRDFIPPILFKIRRRTLSQCGFLGNYASWQEAKKASGGYDSDVIMNKVKDALLKVKNGEAIYERDSVLFDKVQYSWPLLAGLLWIASEKGNRLNIIDFGGSLGSTYFQNRKFLSYLSELRWNIIEQEKFVECGKHYFENKHVKFYHGLDECLKEQHPDVILFSGVIQYLEKPYDLLDEVMEKNFRYIMFDRTTFLQKGTDLLAVQRVPPEIFDASYPCWFFNIEEFKNKLLRNYELIAEFDGFEKADVTNSIFKGFIFRKRQDDIETL